MKKFKKILKCIIYYSNLQYIYEKIKPANKDTKPTFFIWCFGIYFALFGIAFNRYESSVDKIETMANSIFAQLSTDIYKFALGNIALTQDMKCPVKPIIYKPWTTFLSLSGDEVYHNDMVNMLKQTLCDWKYKLNGVSLRRAQLQNANLKNANLQNARLLDAKLQGANLSKANLMRAELWNANLHGADLSYANLLEAKNLLVKQLCQAKTLYRAKLDPKILKLARKKCPKLFDKPDQIE